jgi:putative ABC transport system ATP-binding protein
LSDPVFRARGLTKTYRMGEAEVHALRGVDLEIRAGEFIVLLGPSGSGKSTLLNILGGLDTPTSGDVRFLEHQLTGADEGALTRYRREHVGERLDHFPSQLSGGEQQRVAIARAIAKRPQVLLCDEPTGALDYETGKLVLEVIAKINAELGTTAMVITHNAAISGMADRVLRLGNGRIVGEEKPARKLTPAEIVW